MKLKKLCALVLVLSVLLSCMVFAIPAAADAIESEVIGASIRVAGKQGLRFVGKIAKSGALQTGEDANFGFLLLPKSTAIGGSEITVSTSAVKKVPAVNLLKEEQLEAVGVDTSDYDDYYYFSAVIIGIPGEFYTTDILARVYVTVNEEDQYSEQAARSVQYVANAINEMGGEVPAFITEVLETVEAVGYDILVNADLFWKEVVVPDPGEDPVDPGEDPVDPGEDPVDPGEDPVDPGEIGSSFGAYKYVAFIGVDGGGSFFQNTSTPNIDSIFANGATTYNCYTPVSISAQSWGSMLHGVTADYHKLTNSSIAVNRYPTNSAYPSIFRALREADPNATMASVVGWPEINYGIVEEGFGVTKLEGNSTDDSIVRDLACNYLDSQIPTLLFIQYDHVDDAGHTYGWGSDNYYTAIRTVDEYIGDVFAKYEEAGVLDDTLFIVTADHGGSGTGHGGSTADHCRVLLGVRGKTVVNGTIGEVENRDIAAIALYALGIEQPAGWTARVPSGLFEGVTAQDRPVPPSGNISARYHNNQDTPANTLTYLANNVSKSLYLYLPLDGDATDATGQKSTSTNGKLYFGDDNGYYGGATAFDDGYVSVSNYYPGTDDFSISFWINTNGTMGDPAILANKDWASGANSGWVLALHSTRILFNFGNGSGRRDIGFTLPSDYQDGWVHVIITVNHSANQVKCYYDFVEKSPEYDKNGLTLTGTSLTSGSTLNIGQDGLGHEQDHLPGFLDDVMIFNGVLTASDVAALKAYYGK